MNKENLINIMIKTKDLKRLMKENPNINFYGNVLYFKKSKGGKKEK